MTAPVQHEIAGIAMSGSGWLDSHFAAARAEYQAMFASVPFDGGRILDAGCGNGIFLPALGEIADLLVALDMASEHLRALPGERCWPVAGTIAALPFVSGTFDAIWSSNVAQFLDDAEFEELLREFVRVLRPGGLLAIKDCDMTGWRVDPAPAFLGLHLAEANAHHGNVPWPGAIRGRRLRSLLEAAGFSGVQQTTQLIERWAPLDEATVPFWTEWLLVMAEGARSLDLPAEDAAFWRSIEQSEAARAFVSRSDFYGCEMQVVVHGRTPEAA